MDIFKKLNYIFDRKQKWQTLGLFALIVLGTVFELLGVSTVQPLINAIMDRDNLSEREEFIPLFIICFICRIPRS